MISRCAPLLSLVLSLLLIPLDARAQALPSARPTTGDTLTSVLDHTPWEYGVLTQDGIGLTENRSSFKFASLGLHAGKVLTDPIGHGALRGNFEYAVEAYPFWQSYTPTFMRANCVASPSPANGVACSPTFQVGGTFSGVTIIPIILRWNLNGTRRVSFWGQAAGGVLWTNHKYPAFGGIPYTLTNDGPNADASVWNFTPQGGVGIHYFLRPRRSLDLGVNAVHISSASLGDRNPGVNASLQFTLGYTFWK